MGKRDLHFTVDHSLKRRKAKARPAKVMTWQTKVYTTYVKR
jgi:hypothetical protein